MAARTARLVAAPVFARRVRGRWLRLAAAAALWLAAAAAGVTETVPATSQTPALPAYVARPAGATVAPGVLVLHGCDGYNSRYAALADWLASQGYVAVAIDSLGPRGRTNACGDWSGSRNEALDALATLDWMRTQRYIDGSRLALLGYSMGAIATLDIVDPRRARTLPPGLRAAVAYYPACRNRDAVHVLVPLRILDGGADDWTPAPPCQALAQNAKQLGKAVTITTYAGATHAFNVDKPERISRGHLLRFDASAALDARMQTLDFLQRYLR